MLQQTMPQPERLIFSSTPANIEDTAAPEPHSVAQTISNTTEIASNEVILVLLITNFLLFSFFKLHLFLSPS